MNPIYWQPRRQLTRSSGGAVLHEILSLGITDVLVSALVRHTAQVDGISKLGVKAIVFKGLHDIDVMKSTAAEHDGEGSWIPPTKCHLFSRFPSCHQLCLCNGPKRLFGAS